MLDDTNEQFHQGVLNELDSNPEVPSETRILLLSFCHHYRKGHLKQQKKKKQKQKQKHNKTNLKQIKISQT